MKKDKEELRLVLNLPAPEIETMFVDDTTVVISSKLVGPLPEFGSSHRGGDRPFFRKIR